MVPTPWFHVLALPDGVDYVGEGSSSQSYLACTDFIKGTQEAIIVIGRQQHLQWFGAHLALGYKYQETSTRDFLCALYALEIGLAPVYQLAGKLPPSFERLHALWKSPEYRKMAQEHHRRMWSNLGADIDPAVATEIQEDFRDLDGEDTLGYQAIIIILQLLRLEDGLRIALGLITKRSENEWERYCVRVDGQAASKWEGDEDYDYDGIVWLLNDMAESSDRSSISHWSGVAPAFALPPATTFEDFEALQGAVREMRTPSAAQHLDLSARSGHIFADVARERATRQNASDEPRRTLFSVKRHTSNTPQPSSAGPSKSNTKQKRSSVVPQKQAHLIPRLKNDEPIRATFGSGNETQAQHSPSSLERRQSTPFMDWARRRSSARMSLDGLSFEEKNEYARRELSNKRRRVDDNAQGPAFVRVGSVLQSIPQTASTLRRPSYEMEIDEISRDTWASLSAEEQKYVLTRFGLSAGVSADVFQFGDNYQISISRNDLDSSSRRSFLYCDIENSSIPLGHAPLTERDPYNVPMGRLDHDQEMARGLALSKRPIANAPPWYKDLPWNCLSNMTMEELIIYFPNHVVRWPGLALCLRHLGWDRLFYRTARLINLARGSHGVDDRDRQHVEVLPLMMKIERAIQEIEPSYCLADHGSYGLSNEFVESMWHVKPANFPPDAEVVGLEEAAGYITGYNEFQDREFSKVMQKWQPHTRSARTSGSKTSEPFPFKNPFDEVGRGLQDRQWDQPQQGSGQRGSREQRQPQKGLYGEMYTNMPIYGGGIFPGGTPQFAACAPSPSPAPEPDLPPDCPEGDECISFLLEECPLMHPLQHAERALPQKQQKKQHEQTQQDTRTEKPQKQKQPRSPNKINDICPDHTSCDKGPICQYLHINQPGYIESIQLKGREKFGVEKTKVVCNKSTECNTTGCKFLHPGDEGYEDALKKKEQKQQKQQKESDQKQPHQKPSHSAQKDQPQVQDLPALPWQKSKLCRDDANCKNDGCLFAHHGPKTATNVPLNFTELCKFGAACNKSTCERNHASPAQAAQRGKQGARFPPNENSSGTDKQGNVQPGHRKNGSNSNGGGGRHPQQHGPGQRGGHSPQSGGNRGGKPPQPSNERGGVPNHRDQGGQSMHGRGGNRGGSRGRGQRHGPPPRGGQGRGGG